MRRLGFTLTELLVVLSILAVLGALAVPALRGALDRADRTVCLSNLRQIGQAMHEFVTDRGHYPAAEWPIEDASGRVVERRRWYHALAPYLDAPRTAWSSGQGRAEIDPVTRLATEAVLPSEDDRDQRVFPDVFRCPKCAHWDVGRNMGYGYNHQYLGDARTVGRDEDGARVHRHYPVRPDQIFDAAHTVLICDSAGTGSGPYRSSARPDSAAEGNHGFTVDPVTLPMRVDGRLGSDSSLAGVGVKTLPSRPSDRHRGGTCVLFADYRVEWIPAALLIDDDASFNGSGRATE